MTNTALLIEYIKKSGRNRGYIANAIGKTRATLWAKINGKSDFTATEIEKLCQILDIKGKDRNAIFFAKRVDSKSTE